MRAIHKTLQRRLDAVREDSPSTWVGSHMIPRLRLPTGCNAWDAGRLPVDTIPA